MIEKIMRAVKSNNKKRGRNITIGAVVGILLSCSAVMGAEGNYLWIKNNSGTIEFSTNGNPEGTGEIWTEEDTYETIAGFMMYMLKSIPKKAAMVDFENYTFEVVDVDNFKVDQLLVTKKEENEEAEDIGNINLE